jgi:hypothetical protein
MQKSTEFKAKVHGVQGKSPRTLGKNSTDFDGKVHGDNLIDYHAGLGWSFHLQGIVDTIE